ncbi:chemotaxis protein CheB [Methanomethylovorans sp.]|uniref:chemotaxis protein CheB n=1 Tax=Methanomethylovorans sp. TaxID=2758717 RepID=UPI00351C902F
MVTDKKSTGKKKTPLTKEREINGEVEVTAYEQPAAKADVNNSVNKKFPVVGIGASAGGLAALGEFFSAMPADTSLEMAFVVVQHLAPDRKSMLSEIIMRYTGMQVYEVKDGMVVRPDCIYIIPPSKDIIIVDGMLHLVEPVKARGHRMPINSFFSSLASDQEEWAIGIILSGTGSDGTDGIEAIKAKDGMVMAQSPESSEYNGMPNSAIGTGLVDYILEPAEMSAQLNDYVSRRYGEKSDQNSDIERAMKTIIGELLKQTGHDFSQYKPQTLERRMARRMVVNNIKYVGGYANFLKHNPEETEALFFDLLISVTNFFRNPKVFDTFQEKVIPELFKGRSVKEPVRIWVVGCSTGEEAYSIGILLQEYIERLEQKFKVQIFATDIDKRNIEKARKGVYPVSISDDVPPERLKCFFSYNPESETFTLQESVRSMVIFSEHDLMKDPPFSNIDLISCRNLLIYLNREVQNDLIPMFNHSLRPGGILLLGSSENVRSFPELFDTVDQQSRIYRTKGANKGYRLGVDTFFSPRLSGRAQQSSSVKSMVEDRLQLRELTERSLLHQYAPAGALVNEQGDILYLHGNSKLYLEVHSGEPSNNILKMAREGLQEGLTMALRKAVVLKDRAISPGLCVRINDGFANVDVTVSPVEETIDRKLFLITFDLHPEPLPDSKIRKSSKTEEQTSGEEDKELISSLKEELRTTEEYLSASNEELAVSNEDLRVSNEELQSLNEEFLSTNEELETSREELQSLNEELSTVNVQLQNNVEELTYIHQDMNRMLAGTGIGIIFVDTQLRVQLFTSAVTKIINLIPTDVGRPIGHIVTNLSKYDYLTRDIRTVLDNLAFMYVEVRTHTDEWYLLSIQPYSSQKNNLEGAAITLVDITKLKHLQERQSETLRHLAAVVHDSRDAIILQDTEGKILAWNHTAEKMYGWSEEEALGMNISCLVPDENKDEALAILKKTVESEIIEPYHIQRITKDDQILEIWLTTSALVDKDDQVYAIATTERMASWKECKS